MQKLKTRYRKSNKVYISLNRPPQCLFFCQHNVIMKVISLGNACQVRFNIDRFFKSNETNFFDWLITDFKSVLYILKNINDKNLITESKFKQVIPWSGSKHKIECVEFTMISIHDFPSNIHYMDHMKEFISKYNRRLDRLKI